MRTAQNDIALLKLWEDVELNERVQVACLPKMQSLTFPSPTKKTLFAGWGRNESNCSDACPRELKNMKSYIYDPSDPINRCNFTRVNWKTMICTGNINGISVNVIISF